MVLPYSCWSRRWKRGGVERGIKNSSPCVGGGFLGDQQFREELRAQMAERRGEWPYGEELQESAEARAEKIIGGELNRKGGTEDDLRVRRKGDVFKVRLAQWMRVETTVTLKWVTERFRMDTRGHLTLHLPFLIRSCPLCKAIRFRSRSLQRTLGRCCR